ncbi:MAG: M23 family metallopeptidase [Desulfocurvibacter africanus]
MSQETKKISFVLPVIVIAALALAVGGFFLFHDKMPPEVIVSPDHGPVGAATTFTLKMTDPGSGLKSAEAVIRQNQKSIVLFSEQFAGAPGNIEKQFSIPEKGMQDGPFTLEITVRDASFSNLGKGGMSIFSRDFLKDSEPPRVMVQSLAHNINQGGITAIVYRLSEDVSRTGVVVKDILFPAHLQPDGRWLCLFAFPYFMEKDEFRPTIEAVDIAGNSARQSFSFFANPRRYRQDTITISDSFLSLKVPEFQRFFPEESNNLKVFLRVNSELRNQNPAELRVRGSQPASTPLWSGEFMRMQNAAPMAGFGDLRSYIYQGKKIDEQRHLGIDLASVQHANVPAANNGTVVYAGYLGIYGNCVIVDHGLGLQSIYAHLNTINAAKGDQVNKGQILGQSGLTGMAGGDHLHYEVTLAGISVNPIEWWDKSWIENNIAGKFRGEK